MSTPLTDSINALTAYANETTGAEDTTLSDAVGRLCEGYGQSATPEAMKSYFEKQGFTFSDFVVSEIGSGYMSVSHNLGSAPTEVVAFRKIFENNNTNYQVGVTCSNSIGVDSNRNRTFCVCGQGSFDNNNVINGYVDTIITNKRRSIIVLLSNKNFCQSVTADNVKIRNQNSDNAKPLLGEWWLGVR